MYAVFLDPARRALRSDVEGGAGSEDEDEDVDDQGELVGCSRRRCRRRHRSSWR